MKNIIFYFGLISAYLLTGCSEKLNIKQSIIKELDSTNQIYSIYKTTCNDLEIFTIQNVDTSLLTRNGVIITIPKDAFVDELGKVANQMHIEFKDVLNTNEFIANNIETSYQGRILESAGMFYINVKDQNKNQLTPSKRLTIDFPAANFDPSMAIYKGNFNRNGTIVWDTKIDSGSLKTALLLMPLDHEKLPSIMRYSDTSNKLEKIKKSFISTYQFMNSIRGGLDSIASNIYLNGAIDGFDLWVCDSLVSKHYSDVYFKRFGKKLIVESQEFNDILNYAIKPLNSYTKEKLTKPMYIETYGINLERSDALEKLIKKGLNENDANEAISNYKRVKNILLSQKQSELVFYSFKIQDIGYINIDKLLNNDGLIDAELNIKIANNELPEAVEAFLIYKARKISIKGILRKNNYLDFLNKSNNRIPSGKATLVVLGIKDGFPYFAKKEIIIKQSVNMEITLNRSNFQVIAESLKVN